MSRLFLAANIAILAFLLLPVAIVLLFALNPEPFIAFPPSGFSLRWYAKFLTSRDFMGAFGLSLGLGVATVILAGSIGTLAALAIARGNLPGRHALTAVFLSPLVLPGLLTGFAMFQLVMVLGVGRNTWVLLAGHTVVAIPYVMRTVLAVLANADRSIEEAARGLGATPSVVFREVTLPLIRPGVIAGGLFAFITSFDQFPVSLFLVAPGSETLPITMFNYLRFDFDGTIAAASTVSVALAVLLVLAIERTVGLQTSSKL
ncbi:ABC transporter permease [Roseomonas sp. OT10]|uniref:ABC transporter permease n=1 Tax=Roseomonas cutis TaxID=2897332 RepID=UPI001E59340F|nr:ABC transporter permease [Roseomonas sp. OT10]UFN49735.1 ABC transporter permease [Roseomonas sp. OT10]